MRWSAFSVVCIAAVVLALLAATGARVYAETATVAIVGGSFSVTPANVSLGSVTLGGTDQTATSPPGSNSWSATDARGTGAGWNVTIVSTDFSDGGTPLRTININGNKFKIRLLDSDIGVTTGNTKPTSQVSSLTTIPKTPAAGLKFVSAGADTGMGSYTMNPEFQLRIPAQTYVGTGSYTATITITAVSGP